MQILIILYFKVHVYLLGTHSCIQYLHVEKYEKYAYIFVLVLKYYMYYAAFCIAITSEIDENSQANAIILLE